MTRKLDLISSTTAAQILKVKRPFITTLKRKGRLHGIPVEGTADAYHRAEVQALAVELEAERARWGGGVRRAFEGNGKRR